MLLHYGNPIPTRIPNKNIAEIKFIFKFLMKSCRKIDIQERSEGFLRGLAPEIFLSYLVITKKIAGFSF